MAKLNRKYLKRDRFAEEVGQQVKYLSAHRNKVIVSVAVALALAIGGGSFWSYKRAKAASGRVALHKALDLFHGVVSLENRPGTVTFATTLERIRRTSEAMEGVIGDYAGSAPAAAAEYYLGLLNAEQQKTEEARTRFEAAIDGPDPEYAALSRLAFAEMLEQSGEIDEARRHYERLAAEPTRVVSKARAQVALARTYAASDPAKAREILNAVQQENGPEASMLIGGKLQNLIEGS